MFHRHRQERLFRVVDRFTERVLAGPFLTRQQALDVVVIVAENRDCPECGVYRGMRCVQDSAIGRFGFHPVRGDELAIVEGDAS